MVEREVSELRELGDGGGDGARELVAVQVEGGEAGEPVDGLGDRAGELAAAEVQCCELLADAAELRRNAARNPDNSQVATKHNEAKSNLGFYSTREFNWINTLLGGLSPWVGGPYKSPHLRKKKSRPGNVPLI